VMKEDFDQSTMDACLIAGGQRAEHYEMGARHPRRLGPAPWDIPRPRISSRKRSTKKKPLTRS
jgi:hypothetical protein